MLERHLGSGESNVLTRSFDYVIVGAGSAGCVIARRLVEGTNATILLVEAGGTGEGIPTISNPARWVENIGSSHDWSYRYAPTPHVDHRSIPLARGKVLGGCGSINGLAWVRRNSAVYDDWANAGNAGWDFDSLLPLFKKSEDWEDGAHEFRGAGGPVRVERAKDLQPVATALIDACQSYGMPYLDDMNDPSPEGVCILNLNVRDGQRCGPAIAFLRPVMHQERLTILTEAQAVKLRFSGTRCIGVDILIDDKPHSINASREVVVSAGAIDTPRLLMLSGIGPEAEIKGLGIAPIVNLPGVGQSLQDHPFVAGLCFEPRTTMPPPNNNLSGSSAFWKSRPSLRVPDLMYVPVFAPYVTDEIRAQYVVPPNAFTLAPALMQPQSRGFLRMTTAKHDGPLEIQPNFLKEQADVDALVTGIEIGLEIASQPAFRDLIKAWATPTSKMSREETVAFLRRATASYFHPVGTCAMGTGKEAVVDAKLRIHGIEGLRVADASIMPSIPAANTNAACIMIGEFASREIVSANNHKAAG